MQIQELGLLKADKARLTSGSWLDQWLSDQCCPEAVEEEISRSGRAPGHSSQGDSWEARYKADSQCGEVALADSERQVLSSRYTFNGLEVFKSLLLCSKRAKLIFEAMDVDAQVNSNDCDRHAADTACKLCAGNDPTSVQRQHHLPRTHFEEFFYNSI